jgi:hypothetical protein
MENTPQSIPRTMFYTDWRTEGRTRFGWDFTTWRWRCPVCGHVASYAEYIAAGAPESAVGVSCIGRWLGALDRATVEGGPCTHIGGALNPVTLIMHDGIERKQVFEFAE